MIIPIGKICIFRCGLVGLLDKKDEVILPPPEPKPDAEPEPVPESQPTLNFNQTLNFNLSPSLNQTLATKIINQYLLNLN